MGIAFISYRREDSADTCGRIYDRLVQNFGRERVFKDVDNIPAGVKFAPYLDQMVKKCSVQLVVIGPGWLGAASPNGQRRLDDPNDFVRIEIESALKRGIPVIPVLVQGASLPAKHELPDSLRDLTDHQSGLVRRNPDFHHDVLRLAEGLVQWVGPMSSPAGSGFQPASSAGLERGQQHAVRQHAQAQAQPPVAVGVAYQLAPVAVRTSALAVGSLVVSIISSGFLSFVGIILGHMALREIKRSNGAIGGRGLAITGLVIGYLGTGLIVLIGVILLIASLTASH